MTTWQTVSGWQPKLQVLLHATIYCPINELVLLLFRPHADTGAACGWNLGAGLPPAGGGYHGEGCKPKAGSPRSSLTTKLKKKL